MHEKNIKLYCPLIHDAMLCMLIQLWVALKQEKCVKTIEERIQCGSKRIQVLGPADGAYEYVNHVLERLKHREPAGTCQLESSKQR